MWQPTAGPPPTPARWSRRWKTDARCGSCARPVRLSSERAWRPKRPHARQGGGDPFQRRPVGPGPDSGCRDGRRPDAGRHRARRGVRGGRVGPAAAVELCAGSRRGRSAHGIHGTGAGASAGRTMGDRAARRAVDPVRLARRPARAGRRGAALWVVPGAARRIDLSPLRAGDPLVSRHRRRALAFAALAIGLAIAGLAELGRGTAASPQGRTVSQVVVLEALPAGGRVSAQALGVVRVPARYAAPGVVADPEDAVGRRVAVPSRPARCSPSPSSRPTHGSRPVGTLPSGSTPPPACRPETSPARTPTCSWPRPAAARIRRSSSRTCSSWPRTGRTVQPSRRSVSRRPPSRRSSPPRGAARCGLSSDRRRGRRESSGRALRGRRIRRCTRGGVLRGCRRRGGDRRRRGGAT